jgi:hypothetical protein
VDTKRISVKSREDVQVHVIDLLPRSLAVCEKEVDALTPKPRSPQRRSGADSDREQTIRTLAVELCEPCSVLLRQNQRVTFVHGLDVHDHEDAIILVDDAALEVGVNDAAEEAVAHEYDASRAFTSR